VTSPSPPRVLTSGADALQAIKNPGSGGPEP